MKGEELFYEGEMPHRRRQLAMRHAMYGKFTERSYRYGSVNLVEFEERGMDFLVSSRKDLFSSIPFGWPRLLPFG